MRTGRPPKERAQRAGTLYQFLANTDWKKADNKKLALELHWSLRTTERSFADLAEQGKIKRAVKHFYKNGKFHTRRSVFLVNGETGFGIPEPIDSSVPQDKIGPQCAPPQVDPLSESLDADTDPSIDLTDMMHELFGNEEQLENKEIAPPEEPKKEDTLDEDDDEQIFAKPDDSKDIDERIKARVTITRNGQRIPWDDDDLFASLPQDLYMTDRHDEYLQAHFAVQDKCKERQVEKEKDPAYNEMMYRIKSKNFFESKPFVYKPSANVQKLLNNEDPIFGGELRDYDPDEQMSEGKKRELRTYMAGSR